MIEDPGPPPANLVVRAEREGFYARIWPTPIPPVGRTLGAAGGIAAVSVGVAWVTGTDPWLRVEVAASLALFGVLLGLFALGAGFLPVEIAVDDHAVNWAGDRIPIATVTDCRVTGRTLELIGPGGAVVARAHGIPADAGRWLSLAIKASLPEPA